MKKLLLILAMVFAVITVKAYDLNYAGCYKSVKVEFQSIDENNNPITLSELVTLPLEKDGVTLRKIEFLLLNSMPLTMKKEASATGEQPYDCNFMRSIATEGALTVQVDGEGFSASEGRCIPFLMNNLNARQSIDGLFAAMDYAEKQGATISNNYYTINAGYSLDGGRAVAIQRYLEKYATAEEKARFRLRKTICGGAPLNATETVKFLLGIQPASKYKPLVAGLYEANRQNVFHAISFDEVCTPDSVLRQEVFEGKTAAGKALWKYLGQQNLIENWIPETPITMVHMTNDSVVTYKNAQLAIEAWGKDKLTLLNKDYTGKKWNNSLLHLVKNGIMQFVTSEHNKGGFAYYLGMIDGCLRDTTIADMYGKSQNFYDMLTMLFDISSGVNKDIPINISTSVNGGLLTLRTLRNCHFTADIADSTGTVTTTIEVTLKADAKDSLASKISNVDAKGYLNMPVEFDVNMKKIDLHIYGTCDDLYHAIENLTAIALHRNCSTKEDAEKFCNAFNDNMHAHAHVKYTMGGIIPVSMTVDLIAWYGKYSGSYVIDLYTKYGNSKGRLSDILSLIVPDFDITKYTTIDNQTFKVSDYTVAFHLTEQTYGGAKFYADILKEDSTVMGRVDFDVTGVDMNEEGTCQTLNISFTAVVDEYHAKLVGKCSNMSDAMLAGILCCGNMTCETEEQAQAYADAVNNNLQMELYVEKAGDDGNYPEEKEYTDYGAVHASVAQDEFGAYYVQYCLNWMGKMDLPLMVVLDQLLK